MGTQVVSGIAARLFGFIFTRRQAHLLLIQGFTASLRRHLEPGPLSCICSFFWFMDLLYQVALTSAHNIRGIKTAIWLNSSRHTSEGTLHRIPVKQEFAHDLWLLNKPRRSFLVPSSSSCISCLLYRDYAASIKPRKESCFTCQGGSSGPCMSLHDWFETHLLTILVMYCCFLDSHSGFYSAYPFVHAISQGM